MEDSPTTRLASAIILVQTRDANEPLYFLAKRADTLSFLGGFYAFVGGTVDEVDTVLRDHPVDEVFVVGSAREICELAPVAQDLIEKGRIVSLISTLSGGSNGVRGRVTDFNGIPMISFGPMPKDELRSGMKRAIDVTASVVALVSLSPVMLGVAVLIKLFDPGPVLDPLGRYRCACKGEPGVHVDDGRQRDAAGHRSAGCATGPNCTFYGGRDAPRDRARGRRR